MLFLDIKYINLLTNHFEKFSRKGDYLFNVRCPLCGDSQINKNKMRGYLYRVKDCMAYKCHNCNASTGFGSLLKLLNPQLYSEWTLEILKEKRAGRPQKSANGTYKTFNSPQIRFDKVKQPIYTSAERISDLSENHFCRVYVKNRKIPEKHFSILYFAPSYKAFVDEVCPNHGKSIHDDPRLVIPYYDAYGGLLALTGRDLLGRHDTLRYVTVRVDQSDETKLIYGLDRVNQSDLVYVVEGPLDSLLLNNSVASGDANLIAVADKLSAKKIVLVYDNEPRNKDIVFQMSRAISLGFSVCVWPKWIKEKDINAMVIAGYNPSYIEEIINTNTHSGIRAQINFVQWKKIKEK